MDKEKAKLIFEKFNEILEIVDSEENQKGGYFTISRMNNENSFFNNDPNKKDYYSFNLSNGEIERFR